MDGGLGGAVRRSAEILERGFFILHVAATILGGFQPASTRFQASFEHTAPLAACALWFWKMWAAGNGSTAGRHRLAQSPLTNPEEVLEGIGAAQLHIHPAYAHTHDRRHFQQFQPDAARRRPR